MANREEEQLEEVRQNAYVTGYMVGFKAARGFGDLDDMISPAVRDAVERARHEALEAMGPVNAKRWLAMKYKYPGSAGVLN